ncbi:helix-turn-helix transcriptional regulator [Cognataquiflexum aquatile]|uniref:helix-turn-helix transcriptional regulator n=1 Tax=Cognataquiflexum aquatile TaxID=2249427 RepID=UPI000DE8201E|nr:WYL domain-containing protein [Cognataquiflexum aquatile]
MSKLESLFRQTEIIKIAQKGNFGWEHLDQHLKRKEEDMEYKLCISKRTLTRDLKEIERFFGICIEFNQKTGQYGINNEESFAQNLPLLETFDWLQIFGKKGKVPPYLIFENRVAKGIDNLLPLAKAIENKQLIRIQYAKFWLWEEEMRVLKPLALKEFKNRWYLLAADEKDIFKVFGLDRIKSFEAMPNYFKAMSVDFEGHFRDVFGIINTQIKQVEEVILTFTEFKGRYIKSLPLHHSQEILVDNGNILTIRLKVKIEYELVAEILSHGDEVRVDAPNGLKDLVKEKAARMINGILP